MLVPQKNALNVGDREPAGSTMRGLRLIPRRLRRDASRAMDWRMMPLLQPGLPVLVQVFQRPTRVGIDQSLSFVGQLLINATAQPFCFAFFMQSFP
jgi:hypothetical protein